MKSEKQEQVKEIMKESEERVLGVGSMGKGWCGLSRQYCKGHELELGRQTHTQRLFIL